MGKPPTPPGEMNVPVNSKPSRAKTYRFRKSNTVTDKSAPAVEMSPRTMNHNVRNCAIKRKPRNVFARRANFNTWFIPKTPPVASSSEVGAEVSAATCSTVARITISKSNRTQGFLKHASPTQKKPISILSKLAC